LLSEGAVYQGNLIIIKITDFDSAKKSQGYDAVDQSVKDKFLMHSNKKLTLNNRN